MPLFSLEDKTHVAFLNVLIDDSPAPREFLDDILECRIENSILLPDCVTIRLKDGEFNWIDDDRLREGASITVQAGGENDGLRTLFEGEITALEMDLAAHGVPTLSLVCLDRAHRLQRGRHQRSFVKMKDSDIVKKIAGECGLAVKTDPTEVLHDWVFQNNQTNWEFLRERAARNGYRLYVTGKNLLHFEKVKNGGEGTVRLVWAGNLRSFRPRVSTAGQVESVVVRGWDPKAKQPIIGTSKKANGLPEVGDKGGAEAARPFGPAKMVVVDRPVANQAEADAIARSLFDEIAGRYLEADGLCFGLPSLKPGMQVEIANIGKRFSGKYYTTAVTHIYTPSEGFTTQFSVAGKSMSSLITEADDSARLTAARLGGNIVIGIVTDNKDPDSLGRVKVNYPWLTEEHTSYWARTASQMGGAGRGMFNIPEIDDEVLVAFEHGDIHRPYVIGQLWNGKDRPPSLSGDSELGPSSEVNRRGFYSRIGHQMNFNDTGGKGDISFQTAGGHVIKYDDAQKNVSVTTTGGHNITADDAKKQVEIKTTSGHTITMNDASNKISIVDNAGDRIDMVMGAINITALMAVTINAPLISLDAAVMLNGMAPVTNFMGGVKARFTSRGTMTIDANEDMNLTSKTSIKAEATASMDLKGKPLNLNS